jgi:hypothetical protein
MGSCQLDGLTSFVDKPHCDRAPLAVAKESTSATNIDANLQFLDLMSFSSSAGENGILEKAPLKNRSRRIPRDPATPDPVKDMLFFEKCRCRLTTKLTATSAGKAIERW